MAQPRPIGSMAFALVLGGSLLSPAGAQQGYGTPPAYGSPPPRYPASPPAYDAPRYEAPSPGGPIQLYSRPLESEDAAPAVPDPPPRPVPPTAGPEPMPEAQYPQYPPQHPPQHPPQYPPQYPPQHPPQHPPQYPQYADDDAGPGWSPPGGFLRVQDYQGIRYVSGGVGEGERAELDALSGQFNLRLLFAMQGSGDYLADVRVSVVDSRGAVVLNATSNGPWFLAALPPGSYTVEVSAMDQTQRQSANIGGSSQSRLNFYWR